jgi:hypothetical protein
MRSFLMNDIAAAKAIAPDAEQKFGDVPHLRVQKTFLPAP